MRQTCRLSFIRLLTFQLHSGLPPASSIIMPRGCPCRPRSGHRSFSHLHCLHVVVNKKGGWTAVWLLVGEHHLAGSHQLINKYQLVNKYSSSSLSAGLNQSIKCFFLQVYFVLKALRAHNQPLSCRGISFVPDHCARLHHGDHLAPVTPRDSKAVLILKAPLPNSD